MTSCALAAPAPASKSNPKHPMIFFTIFLPDLIGFQGRTTWHRQGQGGSLLLGEYMPKLPNQTNVPSCYLHTGFLLTNMKDGGICRSLSSIETRKACCRFAPAVVRCSERCAHLGWALHCGQCAHLPQVSRDAHFGVVRAAGGMGAAPIHPMTMRFYWIRLIGASLTYFQM